MRETLTAPAHAAAQPGTGPSTWPGRVTLHFLGTGGVLFDAAAQKVYAANTTATFIWCCLEDGDDPPRVDERLQATFGLSQSEAAAAVAECLRSWRALGLLDAAMAATPAPQLVVPDSAPQPSSGRVDEFRLLDLRLRLRFALPRLRRRVLPMLAPLVAARSATDDRQLRTIDLDLSLSRGRFVLAAGGTALDECRGWDEVVPMLKGQLTLLALRHSRDFAALHAAAVSGGDRCIVLPAESGAGKSTLTAALAAAGFHVLGDDTVVLDADGFEARAIPFGICLKSGAWRLLAGRFPSLGRRPRHRRTDGKTVRYLLPRDGGTWAAPSFRQTVGWIVFPRRLEAGPAELSPVPKLDAMSRLLRGFYPLGPSLDARGVDRLVAWLDGTECLELRYSSLSDAIGRLKELA